MCDYSTLCYSANALCYSANALWIRDLATDCFPSVSHAVKADSNVPLIEVLSKCLKIGVIVLHQSWIFEIMFVSGCDMTEECK